MYLNLRPILFSIIIALYPASGFCQCSTSDIGGVVYRDYDADGSRDSNELGEAGISITLLSNDGSTSSTVSGSDGSYYFSEVVGAGTYRIELSRSSLPGYLRLGTASSTSNSSVYFSDGSNNCDVNFGLSYPLDYCNAQPDILIPCYVKGDPLASGTNNVASLDALVTIPYTVSGRPGDSGYSSPTHIATAGELGAAWGVAYQRSTKTAFVGAFLKRFSGFGSGGTGGIYAVNLNASPATISLFLDLQSTDYGFDSGTNPHSDLTGDSNGTYVDGGVNGGNLGSVSLGDIEMSEDDQSLFVMNLKNQTVYQFPVGIPASAPPLSAVVEFPVSNPGCSGTGIFRTFALAVHAGSLYVGGLCDGSISKDRADLIAYIMKQDLNEAPGNFSSVISFGLDYTRGFTINPGFNTSFPSFAAGSSTWNPWYSDFSQVMNSSAVLTDYVASKTSLAYSVPIFSDIVFDEYDNIIVGLMDRTGQESGNLVPMPFPYYDGTTFGAGAITYGGNGIQGGDVLLICSDGAGGYLTESNGSCGSRTSASGVGNSQGIGGGEFFADDAIDTPGYPGANAHQNLYYGALAYAPAIGELVATLMDPVEGTLNSGGVSWNDLEDGSRDRSYEVYQGFMAGNPLFAKAVGLGDIELLCDAAPIQIGNVIWFDLDKDGVYDPDEKPIAGVSVNLYNASNTLVSSTKTDTSGQYLFSNLSPLTNYVIKLDTTSDFQSGGALYGTTLTAADQGSSDTIDSDGELSSNTPSISITTGAPGENDHTYDFGFVESVTPVIDQRANLLGLDGNAAAFVSISEGAAKAALAASKIDPVLCKDNSTKKKAAILEDVSSAYLEIWSLVWGSLPALDYTGSEINSALCNNIDISATNTKILSLARTAREKVRRLLKLKGCLTSKKSRYLARAKRTYRTLKKGINQMGNNILYCG